ncbi:hypothetical protein C3L33_22045, partial [Rhododendron williamsianum]
MTEGLVSTSGQQFDPVLSHSSRAILCRRLELCVSRFSRHHMIEGLMSTSGQQFGDNAGSSILNSLSLVLSTIPIGSHDAIQILWRKRNRLFNYGIGIHLLENESIDEYDAINEPRPINPKDNHISFQCTDVGLVKRRLEAMGMRYTTAVVEEGGIQVDQVFFHDPDGYMSKSATVKTFRSFLSLLPAH